MVRAVCCEGVTAAGYTLSLPLCLDLDFASFLQFELAVVETSKKLDVIVVSIVQISTETCSNCATSQAALVKLAWSSLTLLTYPSRSYLS